MIIFVATSIYVPKLFAPQPQYNFLYVDGSGYYTGYGGQYAIRDGKLLKTEVKPMPKDIAASYVAPPYEEQLFIYNVKTDQSVQISFQEAQKMQLDSSTKSPDGFEVIYGNGNGGIFPLFFGGYNSYDYNARYLKGHTTTKKLNLSPSTYYNNFRFLGWIK